MFWQAVGIMMIATIISILETRLLAELTLRRATSETSTVGIGGAYAPPPPLEISGLVSPPGLKFGPVIDLHDRR